MSWVAHPRKYQPETSLEEALRLAAHVRAHAEKELEREEEPTEIVFALLGRDIRHAHEALFALDDLDGDTVASDIDHQADADRIEIRYQSTNRSWSSHTWWDHQLDSSTLEIYQQLRADGMPIPEARACAEELGNTP